MARLTQGIGSAVGSLNLDQLLGGVSDIQKGLGSAAKGAGEDLNKQLDETGKKLKSLFK